MKFYFFHLFCVSSADEEDDCDDDVGQEEEQTVDEETVSLSHVRNAEKNVQNFNKKNAHSTDNLHQLKI